MKQNKKLKLTLIILLIVLVSMLSFGGIYVQNKGLIENKMPEYLLARDLKGYRKVELKVSDDIKKVSYDAEGKKIDAHDTTTEAVRTEEVKVNRDESLTKENYELSKMVIEKRLDNMGVKDYEIRQNLEDGKIVLELPENDDTDRVVGNIYLQGKIEVVDNETEEVLMTNDDVESVKSGYGTSQAGTSAIFINIQFNKEGTEKFKNITNTYVATNKVVVGDDGQQKEETVKKQISLTIDDEALITTYFDQEVSNGLMQLTISVPEGTKTEEIQEYLVEANNISSIMDAGKTGVVYEIEQNKFIYSDITTKQLSIFVAIVIAVAAIGIVYLVIKFKEKGILVGISIIGYAAVLLITLRYTNVEISVGGIAILTFSLALDYLMTFYMLKKENVMDTIKKFTLMYIPALIISVVFTLMNVTIGAVLFWSIVVILLYNLVITKSLLK